MAFRATEQGVLPFQGKRALAVRLAVEAGWFEAAHFVAGGAVRPSRASGKLTLVRIFMAIPATLVRDRAPEIRAFVTLGTSQWRVLSG
jgi:hypothetical protein